MVPPGIMRTDVCVCAHVRVSHIKTKTYFFFSWRKNPQVAIVIFLLLKIFSMGSTLRCLVLFPKAVSAQAVPW